MDLGMRIWHPPQILQGRGGGGDDTIIILEKERRPGIEIIERTS